MEKWCFDRVDERNYLYSEICGNINNLPASAIIDDVVDYQNQWLEKLTEYMCVAYASMHWTNVLNHIENLWEQDYGWKDFWLNMVSKWLLDVTKCAYIIDWPITARDEGLIAWFFQVKTLDEVKKAIIDWHPIVTWSNALAWDKVCYAKDSYGHCVLIIWYNEKWLIIKNSYGKGKYDN
jgi:hypothetical protein